MRRILAVLAAVLAASVAVADDTPRIVAVNHALAFMAEELVGDAAEVSFPVPTGVDPSFWRPSISDISAIQSADLILLNGAGFASWIDRVSLPRSRLVNTTAAIEDRFIVTESVTHSHGDGGEHSHEGLASYTWLDPSLAIAQAEAIAATITSKGIAPEAEVAARLAALGAALEALDTSTSESLSALQGVALIATHPRYQYFARAYGLTVTSLEWDAGAAPDAGQLADLEAEIAQTGAQILIWEAAPPPEAIEAASALGLTSVVFPPLAHVPPDGAFLEAFEASVTALANAAAPSAGN